MNLSARFVRMAPGPPTGSRYFRRSSLDGDAHGPRHAVQRGGGVLPRGSVLHRPRAIVRTIGNIVVYLASPCVSLPPFLFQQANGPLGIFSKAIEVLSLCPLIELVKREKSVPLGTSPSGAVEP